ncbi:MAG: hypothetical protein KDL87_09630, partial [Verrucomicrobiae bacterium]|nr:hypothetical protein [Verrucomicrobiae bacterium]
AEGQIQIRRSDSQWGVVSETHFEGASGLDASYWPHSLFVTHNTGVSRLFDTDNDARVDFVKAVAPVWRFGTIGVLFSGSVGLLPSGELLAAPRVLEGPWAGTILRIPESGLPSAWVAGHRRITTPVPGPRETWIVAGIRAAQTPSQKKDAPTPSPGSDFCAISVVVEPAPVAPEAQPDLPAKDEAPSDEEPRKKKDAPKKDEPAPSLPADPISPPVAIRVPGALMDGVPIAPAYPSEATDEPFGPFSGQGFLAGETSSRLLRFWLEDVEGTWQGGVTDFASINSPTPGLSFLRYTPASDELLGGQSGQLFGIRPAGGKLFAVQRVSLASDGFEIAFTEPVNREKAADLASWKLGEIPVDGQESAETAVTLPAEQVKVIISADGDVVTLQSRIFQPGRLYRFDLSSLPAASGAKISHGPVWYTVNRMPTPPPMPQPSTTETEPPKEKTGATQPNPQEGAKSAEPSDPGPSPEAPKAE